MYKKTKKLLENPDYKGFTEYVQHISKLNYYGFLIGIHKIKPIWSKPKKLACILPFPSIEK